MKRVQNNSERTHQQYGNNFTKNTQNKGQKQ